VFVKNRSGWLWIAIAIVVIPLADQQVLQAIGDFLVVQDALVPADVVIAISGDAERVRTASDLLNHGYGRWLLLSGGPLGRYGSVARMASDARDHGVSEARMLLDAHAISTTGNAEGSARLMQARGLHSAILVTSPYHMRRAIIIFRSVFQPRGLSVRAFPVQDSFFKVRGWWWRRMERQLVLREYGKLLALLAGIQ
jgi:uncharacterized SAM-binding protein YcdF (DUF218 family)